MKLDLPPLEAPCWNCGKPEGYRYEPEAHELRGAGCEYCGGKGGKPTAFGEAVLSLVKHYGESK